RRHVHTVTCAYKGAQTTTQLFGDSKFLFYFPIVIPSAKLTSRTLCTSPSHMLLRLAVPGQSGNRLSSSRADWRSLQATSPACLTCPPDTSLLRSWGIRWSGTAL